MDFNNFCNHVKDICFLYGGSVISWIRSPEHNRNVGGHPYSLHLVGLGCDVVFDKKEEFDLAKERCKQLGLSFKVNGMLTLHIQSLPPLKTGGSSG